MYDTILPILVAAVVMLLVWGVGQLLAGLADLRNLKLKQRLAAEQKIDPAEVAQRRVILQENADELSGFLAKWSILARISQTLVYAYPELTLSRFVAIAAGIGSASMLLTLGLTDSLFVSAIAGALGVYAPCVWLAHKKAKRQKMLSDQLPEALDFLSRILKAGHSLSTGLQMMADELPQPLADEFRRAYDQHSLGQPLEDCLKGMAGRIESTDFAFFVTAVLIQRSTGGDLSEVLNNISDMIRQRIRLQQHLKAKTAEGRLTGYILTAFPAVMFVVAYVLNRDYASVLLNTDIGMTLLGVAFGLQMLGLYFIKKITTLTV